MGPMMAEHIVLLMLATVIVDRAADVLVLMVVVILFNTALNRLEAHVRAAGVERQGRPPHLNTPMTAPPATTSRDSSARGCCSTAGTC